MGRRTLINLVLVIVIVFPVWFIVIGIESLLLNDLSLPSDWARSPLFFLATTALPLALAGLAHQLVLLAVPKQWPTPRRRRAAILTSFLVVLTGFVTSGWIGLLLGAPLYGAVVRLPERDVGAEAHRVG